MYSQKVKSKKAKQQKQSVKRLCILVKLSTVLLEKYNKTIEIISAIIRKSLKNLS